MVHQSDAIVIAQEQFRTNQEVITPIIEMFPGKECELVSQSNINLTHGPTLGELFPFESFMGIFPPRHLNFMRDLKNYQLDAFCLVNFGGDQVMKSYSICEDEGVGGWYGLGGDQIKKRLPHNVALDRKAGNTCKLKASACVQSVKTFGMELVLYRMGSLQQDLTE